MKTWNIELTLYRSFDGTKEEAEAKGDAIAEKIGEVSTGFTEVKIAKDQETYA